MKIANKYEKREKETKSESITIRLTPNQFNTIKTNSTKLGVSMSSYITTLIKDDKIIYIPDGKEFIKSLHELDRKVKLLEYNVDPSNLEAIKNELFETHQKAKDTNIKI